ncbi:hypothetical protein Stube_22360 [Streptomyces tubercidicus]|uniref:Uncharacterized protein n=1 Tax=Streptomyces tubercidicus TaxID=47759 RepID=A0A640UNF2_9ACTN|nr:hypothetical protein Stube_22360 [Streptomyces tubercidicus]
MTAAAVQVIGELATSACMFTPADSVYLSLRYRDDALRISLYDGHPRHTHRRTRCDPTGCPMPCRAPRPRLPGRMGNSAGMAMLTEFHCPLRVNVHALLAVFSVYFTSSGS